MSEETYHHDDLVKQHVPQSLPDQRRVRIRQLRYASNMIHPINMLRHPRRRNVPIIILQCAKVDKRYRNVPVFALGRICYSSQLLAV